MPPNCPCGRSQMRRFYASRGLSHAKPQGKTMSEIKPIEAPRNRAAIYARFSTDLQNERSIDDQVALCRAYSERNGLNIVAVFDDRAVSGVHPSTRRYSK